MEVRAALKKDENPIIDLIVNIQRNEFELDITSDDQPDLSNIQEFYNHGFGGFWVAEHDHEIIGTIALLDIGNGNGALRKMFVLQSMRGAQIGIASKLLYTLVDWTRPRGCHNIFLGTVDKFKAAHMFYEKNGFSKLPRKELSPEFPSVKVDNVFFGKKL